MTKEKLDKCAEFLRKDCYEIVDLDSHPSKRDRRLTIDIVAYDRVKDAMVFVLVRSHKNRSLLTRMNNCYRYDALFNVRREGRVWLKSQKWKGKFRIDLIDIYEDGSIDHCTNIMPMGVLT